MRRIRQESLGESYPELSLVQEAEARLVQRNILRCGMHGPVAWEDSKPDG